MVIFHHIDQIIVSPQNGFSKTTILFREKDNRVMTIIKDLTNNYLTDLDQLPKGVVTTHSQIHTNQRNTQGQITHLDVPQLENLDISHVLQFHFLWWIKLLIIWNKFLKLLSWTKQSPQLNSSTIVAFSCQNF